MKLTRRDFLVGASASLAWAGLPSPGARAQGRRNVLFICVDDLRPQLNCYGKHFMVTPHLDAFARDSAVFTNHYVQVPTCGASRCSLLTGMRPHSQPLLGNRAFEELPRSNPDPAFSLPSHFKHNGYTTVGVGKVSHTPNSRRYAKPTGRFDEDGEMIYARPDDHEPELAASWDRVYAPAGEWGDPWSAFFAYAGGKTRSYGEQKSPAVEAADVPDTGYPDGLIAEAAIEELRKLQDAPFFLSVGFYKPHLPFCAPKRYWDMYDRDQIPLAKHPDPPENVDTALSLHRNGELTGRYDALNDPEEATEAEARRLRHGYFAAVSYVDAQIGKVLDELDQLGLSDNTIVVIWGDHGWHLGDLYVWGKHTTFDFSLRSAMLMRVPGAKANGSTIPGLVESLDLYPTLADCCGLEIPGHLHGESFRPLLDEPERLGKDGAFGYYRRSGHNAITLRTERYRIVKWTDGDGTIAQIELYDHVVDPHETRNIANTNPALVERLMKQLEAENPTY